MGRIIIILGLVLMLMPLVYAELPDPNLYYDLDGSAQERLNGIHNGVTEGGNHWVPGIINQGYMGNGIDRAIQLPNMFEMAIQPNANYTACGWFNANTTDTPSHRNYIFNWNRHSILFDPTSGCADGELDFFIFTGTLSTHLCSGVLPKPGQWYHVCTTVNSTTDNMTIYINGTQSASSYIGDTTWDWNSNDAGFVANAFNNVHYFNGTVDEIYFFNNSVFSPEQVNELYQNNLINLSYPFPTAQYPIITVDEPTDGATLDVPVWINLTTHIPSNCSLNDTGWGLLTTPGLTHSFNDTGVPDGYYNISIACSDSGFPDFTTYTTVSFTKTTRLLDIIYPTDNLVRDDPLNVTFYFTGFDPLMCVLYTNETGTRQAYHNITSSLMNQSTFYDINTTGFNTTDAIAMYRFEEGNGSTALDHSINSNDGVITSASYIGSKQGNNTGDYSLAFSSGSVIAPHQDYYDLGTSRDISFSVWARSDHGSDGAYHMIIDNRDGSNDGLFLAVASDDTIQAVLNTATMSSTTKILDSAWHHVVAVWDRDDTGTTELYIDNVSQSVGVDTSGQNVDLTSDLYIGRRSFSIGIYWEGDLDEVYIFNKTLGQNDVSELYTQGLEFLNITTLENVTEVSYGLNRSVNHSMQAQLPPDIRKGMYAEIECRETGVNTTDTITFLYDNDFNAPVITILSPVYDANLTDVLVDINVSTDEPADCTINDTRWALDYTDGLFHHFQDQNANSSFYTLSINCSDGSGNSASAQTRFLKDAIFPTITWFFPYQDNTTVLDNLGSFQLDLNITDDLMLFSYEINITRLSDHTVVKTINGSVSDLRSVRIKEIIDTNSYQNTTYEAHARACDGHTKKLLKKTPRIKKTDKTLRYEYDNAVINITSIGGDEVSTETVKHTDRYDFRFKYSKPGTRRYMLSSDSKIVYLPSSEFKGHFIINGEYWVDFESDDTVTVIKHDKECDKKVKNKRCFPAQYEIILDTRTDNDITFNSIGELNCEESIVLFTLLPFEEPFYVLNLNDAGDVLFLTVIIILWLGLMVIGFWFRSPVFIIMGTVIGFMMGIYMYNIHIIFTLVAFFGNVLISYTALAKGK